MRILCSLLFVIPAFADSTVINGVLLNQAGANQLATWFGQGDQTFTNVSSIAGGTANGATTFHSDVDGIGPTFILVQTNLGLVGGYNPASWDKNINGYLINPTDAGRTAFLFNLSNPAILHQRLGDSLGQYQTYHYQLYGPTFGGGHDLAVTHPNLSNGYANPFSYGGGISQPNVFGSSAYTFFSVSRVEAYTFAPSAPATVPEPAAVSLISAALGGLAFLRRMRKTGPASSIAASSGGSPSEQR